MNKCTVKNSNYIQNLLAHNQSQLTLAHTVFTNIGLCVHFANSKSLIELCHLDLHHQNITRDDWFTPSNVINTTEEEVILLCGFTGVNHDDAAELGHCLHLENTGHDGTLREMAREEVIVNGHAFVANSVLAVLPFDDTVDEEEGISVGEREKELIFGERPVMRIWF